MIVMNDLNACIKIAAYICAKDGVISEAEEKMLFQLAIEGFPNASADDIELALCEFFDSNQLLEDYLGLVDDEELRRFTLDLAATSASADGLSLEENIALNKVKLIWGAVQNV